MHELSYSAKFDKQTGDTCSYQIEEKKEGKRTRLFTGSVPCTQKTSAKGWEAHSDERKIERWCKLYPAKLPKDGGQVEIDLSYVAME